MLRALAPQSPARPQRTRLAAPLALARPSWAQRPLAGAAAGPSAVFTAPSFGNRVAFHPSAEGSLKAMLGLIQGAQRSLNAEFFIWHDDATGRAVADALVAKVAEAKAAGRPFEARVLIDATSLRGKPGDARLVERLRAGGVDVRLFNASLVDRTAGGVPITHRKLLVADGQKAYSGGRNVGDEYLAPTYTNPAGRQEAAWTDLAISLEGPEAVRLWRLFMGNWALSGGQVPAIAPQAQAAPGGGAKLQSVVTNPHAKGTELAQAHLKLIASAERELFLSYPYFSDDALIQALIEAKRAKPGLRIRALFPGSGEGGHASFLYGPLNLVSAKQLAEVGIEVRFTGLEARDGAEVRAYSHQKAMLVDGRLLSVGSANADARTMANNHELNVLLEDAQSVPAFAREVLEPAWARAKAPTAEELKGTWIQRLWRGLLEALDFLL